MFLLHNIVEGMFGFTSVKTLYFMTEVMNDYKHTVYGDGSADGKNGSMKITFYERCVVEKKKKCPRFVECQPL